MESSLNTSTAQSLSELTRTQLERMSYIDFRLYFLGELRRVDVMTRFGIAPAGATRDIAQYRELAPRNLFLDSSKVYRPNEGFSPLFEHSPQRVLTALSQGFGEGVADQSQSLIRCELPAFLTQPSMSVLAPITRAINLGKAVRLGYTSIESGRTERDIVPLALVTNAVRWHVRAFDRKHHDFRDFVLSRMDSPVVLDGDVSRDETFESDVQWSRVIELELVPHPRHPRPEVVKMDYNMPDGVLRVKVRAAHAGYLLRLWAVDCSPNHVLGEREFSLWLRDPLTLYGSSTAMLAPGYVAPQLAGGTKQ